MVLFMQLSIKANLKKYFHKQASETGYKAGSVKKKNNFGGIG